MFSAAEYREGLAAFFISPTGHCRTKSNERRKGKYHEKGNIYKQLCQQRSESIVHFWRGLPARQERDAAKRMERQWLNETAQKRAAAAGAESAVYAVASDEDGRNEVREYFGVNYLRHCAEEETLRYVAGRDVVGITLNDFNSLHCAPDSLLDLCGFSVRMDWKFTRGYQNRNQSAVKDEVLAKCKKNGLPVPTQMVETHRGLQAVWYLKEQKPANFLPVWNVLQNCLCEMFGQFGAASVRLGVCETVDLPVNGKKLLHSQKQPTSWDAMYNALRRAYYMRAYSAIAAKYYPDPAHRPTWYHTQQLIDGGTLQVPADEQPKPFIVNAPSYQWLRSGGWDEDLIVDAEPAVTTKCGRPMSSARASQTVGMMPAYYGEVAEDLLKLVQLRKGEFSAEMQQRLLFYIYVYSVLKISYKRDGDAPAAEAVRAADALMRHPMTPEMLEQRISGLRASARYDRTSVSRNRVISDLQITVAEQKQLKRLLGHEEDLRRKSKSGMLRSERDAALDTAIVEMLAQGKLHREIGEKLGMARESVTRRIRRNNLLREVQEARNALAKEQARAKRAEKDQG